MNKEFELNESQFETLMAAMKPTPMIMLQCGTPPSVQERANAAWAVLGKELGVDPMTARPSSAVKGLRFFMAKPVEQEK